MFKSNNGIAMLAWIGLAIFPVAPLAALEDAGSANPNGRWQTAVFAGGCFWGVDAVFRHVKGVAAVESGYAGGDGESATYEQVGTGTTGHAEAVRVRFDQEQVSYRQLLQVFFDIAHDPTQLDRQGPDVGSQYRSAIFHTNAAQHQAAADAIVQLSGGKGRGALVVTRLEPLKQFYPAEAYHQDYLARHPTQPYIIFNDLPKLNALRQRFPDLYRHGGIRRN